MGRRTLFALMGAGKRRVTLQCFDNRNTSSIFDQRRLDQQDGKSRTVFECSCNGDCTAVPDTVVTDFQYLV